MKTGRNINLYFDADGYLVITDEVRDDLTPFSNSQGFKLNAPLDDVVTADVTMIVGNVDLKIPPDQVRLIVGDQDIDAEMLEGIKRTIEARRAVAEKA